MLKTIFLLFLLSSTSKCNLLDGIEPVHHGVLLAYFSDPVLQVAIYLEFFFWIMKIYDIAPPHHSSTNQGIIGISRNIVLRWHLGSDERQWLQLQSRSSSNLQLLRFTHRSSNFSNQVFWSSWHPHCFLVHCSSNFTSIVHGWGRNNLQVNWNNW